ncbi:hypothetical protein GCM10023321_10960 [Pseudonocardia eucalypti]|uniref:Uncharacterized protein n=1 Tax=Pseudonocardia eucalypti TaxID=648755 RepID=A0ABP9PLB4_9PSEU
MKIDIILTDVLLAGNVSIDDVDLPPARPHSLPNPEPDQHRPRSATHTAGRARKARHRAAVQAIFRTQPPPTPHADIDDGRGALTEQHWG